MQTDSIEQNAAQALGLILFEFTRLDMNLGLYVVWTNDGRNLEELTRKYNEKSFSCRLGFIDKLSREKFVPGSDELNSYTNWVKDANEVREIRNELVHGRYGFIPREACVANVIGLPTSPEQYEKRYTVKQLKGIVEQIRKLNVRLNELRDECPI